MLRDERFPSFFLFQGGVYQSLESNLPPQHVSIIIILPIYTTALVQFHNNTPVLRPESVGTYFIRTTQPGNLKPELATPLQRHLLKTQGSWVSDKASCLPRHPFSSVSDSQRPDYQTPLIVAGVLLACLAIDYRVLFSTLTEETVEDGFQYYRTFYNAPPGIKVRNVAP